MPTVKTKNQGIIDMSVKDIFENGNNALMYLLYENSRDRHEGMAFHSFSIHHHQDIGYSISIGKLPGIKMDLIIIWQSNVGWLYDGPWIDVFLEYAEKLYQHELTKVDKFAKLWKADLA